ncbi:MAG: ComF family protein [Proteobacteria bacterium]|nr:ComF family protein [Pseudomonadota bacterium]
MLNAKSNAKGWIELLVPSRCAVCERWLPEPTAVCSACDAMWPWLSASHCSQCQARAPWHGDTRCLGCRGRRSPLAACLAAVAFDATVETWTHRFKYPTSLWERLDPAPGLVLRHLVRAVVPRAPGTGPDAVIPVPLHPKRLRARGFNPAALLAEAVAERCRRPWPTALLVRRRHTPSQTGLDRAARRRNVRNAFAVHSSGRVPRDVWLVDDVVTTGATLEAAARALRRAGARRIVALCAARTLPHRPPVDPATQDG